MNMELALPAKLGTGSVGWAHCSHGSSRLTELFHLSQTHFWEAGRLSYLTDTLCMKT